MSPIIYTVISAKFSPVKIQKGKAKIQAIITAKTNIGHKKISNNLHPTLKHQSNILSIVTTISL
jgi:hypothetical protein